MQNPIPKYTLWEAIGAALSVGMKALTEVRDLARQPGPQGDPRPQGKLPLVKAWEDGLYRECEVVTHQGATWQASKDTGKEPPHADWTCLARAGRDGVDAEPFAIEGTFDANRKDYRRNSVV